MLDFDSTKKYKHGRGDDVYKFIGSTSGGRHAFLNERVGSVHMFTETPWEQDIPGVFEPDANEMIEMKEDSISGLDEFKRTFKEYRQELLKAQARESARTHQAAEEGPSLPSEEFLSPGEEFLSKYKTDKNKKSVEEKKIENRAVKPMSSQILNNSMNKQNLPSVIYRPRIFVDGNMWCVLWGENLIEGVAGFGKSPAEAVNDFDKNWFKAIK